MEKLWDPYAEFETTILPNGLTIHAAHWPNRAWETIGFVIHSGGEHDPVGLEGLAHFVEHVISLNASVPRKETISFFEGNGGQVDLGETGYANTQFQFFAPADSMVIAKALDLFGKMLLPAKLINDIESERQVIGGEFNCYCSVQYRYDVNLRGRQMVFHGDWPARTISPFGAPESINRITANDLQVFYDRHYTPANMSVVCVGGMSVAEITTLLANSALAVNKPGSRTPLPIRLTDVSLPLEQRYVLELSKHVTRKEVPLVSVFSVAKVPGALSHQMLHVLVRMLSSILMREVRDKRAWTYSIYGFYRDYRHLYEVAVDCDTLVAECANEIERVVTECIAMAGQDEVLFDHMKRSIRLGMHMLDQNGWTICAHAMHDLAAYQRIISLAENLRLVDRVTMDDVRELMKWLAPERRWTLLVVP